MVMNPLQVSSSSSSQLSSSSRHTSLHASSGAAQQPPSPKKRKIGENGTASVAASSSTTTTTLSSPSIKEDQRHHKQRSIVSGTEPNSSCSDPIHHSPFASNGNVISSSRASSSLGKSHAAAGTGGKKKVVDHVDAVIMEVDDYAKKDLPGDGECTAHNDSTTEERTRDAQGTNAPATKTSEATTEAESAKAATKPTYSAPAAATSAAATSAAATSAAATSAAATTAAATTTATATNATAITTGSDATHPATSAVTTAITTAAATTPYASTSQGSLSSSFSSNGKPAATSTATVSVTEEKSPPPPPPPHRSTKMSHLRQKYTGELEYMLREFEKLERQLLGARKTEESAASRERREKLHSFILHLTETIQQIEKGCELEEAGKSTLPATQKRGEAGTDHTLQDTAPTEPPLTGKVTGKEEEENVQKLEEHILANLLPVKVRLKKQLAAQQGAKHNPATMPHRGALTTPAAGTTFADSARRQQEAAMAQQQDSVTALPAAPVAADETQFGKPLVKGSSLTKKLHGPTLGSSERAHGDGVGASSKTNQEQKKKYVGGLAVGSAQMESSFDAASNVHKIVIQEPALVLQNQGVGEEAVSTQPTEKESTVQKASTVDEASNKPAIMVQYPNDGSSCIGSSGERRRKLRRKKRKKMRLKEQVKAAAAEKREMENGRKQKTAKKSHRGPRHVEYMCALCNEVYNSTCDYNPWWALSQHDCPKCRKRQVSLQTHGQYYFCFCIYDLTSLVQIPRIDIGAPANAIEYHPALLAHAEENGGVTPPERCAGTDVSEVTTSSPPSNGELSEDESMDGSDLSSEYDDISTDDDMDSLDSEMDGLDALSPSDRAEQERFGADYSGPRLENREASRLLILMAHASTCPCQHNSHEHAETCRSVKWMMLHVRDCPGTTYNFDVCPFPWCRKVKHLLYHLVSCQDPQTCDICTPSDIGKNLVHLKAHSEHRLKAYRRTLLAKFSSNPKKIATETIASAVTRGPNRPHVQAKSISGTPCNQSDASQNTVPATPVPPLLRDKSSVDTDICKAEVSLSGTTSAVPGPNESLPSAEETKSSADHPEAAISINLVDESVGKKSSVPADTDTASNQEEKKELSPTEENSKAQQLVASVLKSETSPADHCRIVINPSLNVDKKTAGDGNGAEEKQPDVENAGLADKRGARFNTFAVKPEEAEDVVTDKTSTSEFGTLVENTNAGEKTSELLEVQ